MIDEENHVFAKLYKDPLIIANPGRVFYFSRHGESMNNLTGKIGGNANLSPNGQKYAAMLANYFNQLKLQDLQVWHSEFVRTKQTAANINAPKMVVSQINEISAGLHDEMTYEEIAYNYPKDFAERDQDKLRYRYPFGESYIDVCSRLSEIIPTMMTTNNLLIISHQATLRCIVNFLRKKPQEQLPYEKVPLHTLFKVTVNIDGSNMIEEIKLGVQCVDTYRAKPTNCRVDRSIEEAIASVPAHF